MKKGLYRIGILFAVASVMGVLLFGCGKEPEVPTVTDAQGMTYMAVEDKDTGETYAAVEGEDGKIYAARIDDEGKVRTDEETFEVTDYDGTLPANDTTAVSVDSSQGETYDFATGEVVTEANGTTEVIPITESTTASSGKKDSNKENTSASSDKKDNEEDSTANSGDNTDTTAVTENNEVTSSTTADRNESSAATSSNASGEVKLLAEKYKKLFSSGTYYVEFSTNDEDMKAPVTAAIKNGNIYMETELEGLQCTMIYKKSKDKVYAVLPKYRSYCILSSDMIDDLDMSNFTELEGVDDVKVYNAKVGDKKCLCEKYSSKKTGESATYYFYNQELVRIDQVDKFGDVSVMNIIKISSTVPDSLFDIPKGYMPVNLSMLDLG